MKKQKNEEMDWSEVLSSPPAQRRRHHRSSVGRRMAELQTVAHDGRQSRRLRVTESTVVSPTPALPFPYECTPAIVNPRRHPLHW